MTDALCDRSGAALSAQLAAGETSATEIVASTHARIEAVDGDVRAFLTPTPQLATERAEELDAYLSTGAPQSPVAGIPVALKDVLTTNGIRTTCGSKILESYVPPYDATAWTRLAGAGAVLVGKTNCDEFAMGSSNENSAYGPVHNPWDLERVPGGLQRGLGGGRRGRRGGLGARDRHRRQRAPAGLAVRRGRAQADVRTDQPIRLDRVRLVARHRRHVHPDGSRRGLDVAGPRGPRSARRDLARRAGPGLHPRRSTRASRACGSGVIGEAFGEGVDPAVAASVRAAVDRLDGLGASVGEASCRTPPTRCRPTT